MVDQATIDLINRGIDGELNSEEQESLDQVLKSDPEALAYYDEHKRMASLIGRIKAIEPSENLHRSIVTAIQKRQSKLGSVESESGLTAWLRSLFVPKSGIVFAGGLAAGLAIFALFARGPLMEKSTIDPTSAVGAILPNLGLQKFSLSDSRAIQLGDQRVQVEIVDNSDLAILNIRLQPNSQVALDMAYDQEKLILLGINMETGGIGEAQILENSIGIPSLTSPYTAFVFRRQDEASTSLTIKLQVAGNEQVEKLVVR